jgi:SAM-dependent methyltransferase
LLSPLSPTDNVLEFGAGIGTLAQLWFDRTGVKPECLEIDPDLRNTLIDRGFICHKDLDAIEKNISAIYTSNVLEHIEDDVEALKELYKVLNEGSKIVIYVPAFMSIYSDLDAHVGHFRRYSKKEIIKKLNEANFEIIKCHYTDSIGFFAWAYMKWRGYNPLEKNQSKRQLIFYDCFLYPLSRFLDRIGFKYLFGKNILVVARK